MENYTGMCSQYRSSLLCMYGLIPFDFLPLADTLDSLRYGEVFVNCLFCIFPATLVHKE